MTEMKKNNVYVADVNREDFENTKVTVDDLVAFCSASNIYWNHISDVSCDKRHPDCTLIEIPKDAKLVDANKLLDKSEWYGERATYDNPMPDGEEAVSVESILNAPTIFEEEEK